MAHNKFSHILDTDPGFSTSAFPCAVVISFCYTKVALPLHKTLGCTYRSFLVSWTLECGVSWGQVML